METASEIKKLLKAHATEERRKQVEVFFKKGKGSYSEHDVFIGVTMPELRQIAKKYIVLKEVEIQKLLDSKFHEERMCGLLILVYQYQKGDNCKKIFSYYVKNIKSVNNWDLVDVTTPSIIGDYLLDKDKKLLYTFVKSDNLWERRIAIVSTYTFIKKGKLKDTIKIATLLLKDKHDLIHKAVGWMLREVGKKDIKVLEQFLKQYATVMPRTMLRYAIERFEEKKRKHYLISSKDLTMLSR